MRGWVGHRFRQVSPKVSLRFAIGFVRLCHRFRNDLPQVSPGFAIGVAMIRHRFRQVSSQIYPFFDIALNIIFCFAQVIKTIWRFAFAFLRLFTYNCCLSFVFAVFPIHFYICSNQKYSFVDVHLRYSVFSNCLFHFAQHENRMFSICVCITVSFQFNHRAAPKTEIVLSRFPFVLLSIARYNY